MKIYNSVLELLVRDALGQFPNECCGLLAGREGLIDEIRCCSNQLGSPTAFSISPEELVAAFKDFRARGRELLGIYHSHPAGEAIPSERDVREFNYPGTSYWILGLRDALPEIRCFNWEGKGFREVPFQVLSEHFRG